MQDMMGEDNHKSKLISQILRGFKSQLKIRTNQEDNPWSSSVETNFEDQVGCLKNQWR